MYRKQTLIALLIVLVPIMFSSMVYATSITTCTFGKEFYYPGQTGFINVAVYNDKDYKIRITGLTADVHYYYLDGVVYEQTFFTNATLPIEVQSGDTCNLFIPFSLPTNIAPGYTQLYVRATNELWNTHSSIWSGAEYPSYRPNLYIESPYKPEFQQLQATNNVTTIIMYLLGVTALVFGVIALSIFILSKRTHIATPA